MPNPAPAGLVVPQPDVNQRQTPPQQAIPFRYATIERTDIIPNETGNMGAGAIRLERQVPGSGLISSVFMQAVISSTGNAAAVALTEDAPYAFYDSVIFRDVNGELLNLQGFNLFLANLAQKNYIGLFASNSGDAYVQAALTTGAGATAGSGAFPIWLPITLNRRDLIGLLGNQDRSQSYFIRHDVAALGSVYSVAPNGTVAYTITKIYENYGVPNAMSPNGVPQEILPAHYGTLHYITQTQSDAAPVGGSNVNHYLRRVGNTVRYIILVFRTNGSRANVELAANRPTSIRFKLGDDTIFNETYDYRRAVMYMRYGFTWPNGVLIYDAMHDFTDGAGNELGADYYHTQAIQNAQFQISYPAGFGSTNNSLVFVTDDLQRVSSPQR